MEEWSRKEEACPQLLELIPKDTEWLSSRDKDGSHGSSEEKKLELRLGPPGEDWFLKDTSKISKRERDESRFSLGYFSPMASISQKNSKINNENQTQKFSSMENPVRCVNLSSSPWSSSYKGKIIQHSQQQTKVPSFLEFPSVSQSLRVAANEVSQSQAPSFLEFPSIPQSLPVAANEVSQSQICGSKGIDWKNSENKVFSPAPPSKTDVPNSTQKRTASASVVGWPPIRSFRKNHASSSSSKPLNEPQNMAQNNSSGDKSVDGCKKGPFVKINMDGVPIGRKVDLNAYASYEKLSSAVDELFRGLLAAQRDSSSAGGIQNKQGEEKEKKNLLDGSGEFTLLYEDNEGDRMLIGDLPWHMFVSNVKRLRVLKSSELPALSRSKQEKRPVDYSKLK